MMRAVLLKVYVRVETESSSMFLSHWRFVWSFPEWRVSSISLVQFLLVCQSGGTLVLADETLIDIVLSRSRQPYVRIDVLYVSSLRPEAAALAERADEEEEVPWSAFGDISNAHITQHPQYPYSMGPYD